MHAARYPAFSATRQLIVLYKRIYVGTSINQWTRFDLLKRSCLFHSVSKFTPKKWELVLQTSLVLVCSTRVDYYLTVLMIISYVG